MGYKWRPSRTAKKLFVEQMQAIDQFCIENGIVQSASSDSYYFTVGGVNYRVSNHSVEKSNSAAFNQLTGEQIRGCYHADGRKPDTVYIHAGKTRIIQIYSDIKSGYRLDGNGNRKN